MSNKEGRLTAFWFGCQCMAVAMSFVENAIGNEAMAMSMVVLSLGFMVAVLISGADGA